jgi:transposase
MTRGELRSHSGHDVYLRMPAEHADGPDELWERVKQWLPTWRRSPLGGPRRLDGRKVFADIVYRLRTGCQWDATPSEFGSGSTCHPSFAEWVEADAFGKIHAEALCYYHEKVGLDLALSSSARD